jgi:hypothetical protein
MVLAALGMGLLVYPLIQGQQAGWPAWTYLMAAGSALAFGLLVAWSRRQRRAGNDPLVEASIFSHRPYTAGLVTIVVFFAGMIGTLLVLTLFLQLGEHFTAIHAGLTLAPFAVGTAAGATLAGAVLVPRLGRTALQAATVVMAGGVWWLHEVVGAHGSPAARWRDRGRRDRHDLLLGARASRLRHRTPTVPDRRAGHDAGAAAADQHAAVTGARARAEGRR